ncbi:hypothetical protein CVU37_00895 [candidate division BRC1 bacterium HGW-BRC1-1]|nr:MAG: hypothetical protein CVU37_00895 [candidate division BRC1 bacterium HGW-BRC1-1]
MRKAFTLIELLIVVAIIAILAAIAVPNFLEAQVRSKVSRAKADIRSLATGLEAYRVDNTAYPSGNQYNVSSRLTTDPPTPQYMVLERLSTPVAYMTNGLLPDPFQAKQRSGVINGTTGDSTPSVLTAIELQQEGTYKYLAATIQPSANVLALTAQNGTSGKAFWSVWSAGPTLVKPQIAGTGLMGTAPVPTPQAVLAWVYDSTNGTISRGGIFRVGGAGLGSGEPGGVFFETVSKTAK